MYGFVRHYELRTRPSNLKISTVVMNIPDLSDLFILWKVSNRPAMRSGMELSIELSVTVTLCSV